MAFEAGALGKQRTEEQTSELQAQPLSKYSGSYLKVLPRMISTDLDGNDAREFLLDFFPDAEEMLSKLFLKGYQWPFDVRKVDGGSSIIDILVYLELCKNRRV